MIRPVYATSWCQPSAPCWGLCHSSTTLSLSAMARRSVGHAVWLSPAGSPKMWPLSVGTPGWPRGGSDPDSSGDRSRVLPALLAGHGRGEWDGRDPSRGASGSVHHCPHGRFPALVPAVGTQLHSPLPEMWYEARISHVAATSRITGDLSQAVAVAFAGGDTVTMNHPGEARAEREAPELQPASLLWAMPLHLPGQEPWQP